MVNVLSNSESKNQYYVNATILKTYLRRQIISETIEKMSVELPLQMVQFWKGKENTHV